MQKLTIGKHQVYIYKTAEALKTAVAEHMIITCARLAQDAPTINISLSGGSTPVGIYQNLVNDDFTEALSQTFLAIPAFPWQQVRFFFGDERYVPHKNMQSNYRMACEAFLNQAPIDNTQIFPIPTDCKEAGLCAQRYAEQLSVLPQKQGVPVFDYMLLGIGDDGHTASLFPDTTIIKDMSSAVAAVYVEKLKSWRISMTFPVLNQARVCVILASGEAKATVLANVLENKQKNYPISMINNSDGLIWFVDQAAASKLNLGHDSEA